MSLKSRSIKGLIWDFFGRVGLQGVGFVISIVLARILAPEDFGILAILTVFIYLASVFLDFGFSTALIQRAEVTEAHYSSVFYMNVTMGIVLAISVLFIAPFVASFYENEQLTSLVRFMSLAFIVNSFGNVIRARLRREMNFKLMSIISIFSAFISGIVAVYMAWDGFGVWSLAVQSIINQLLNNVLLYFFAPIRICLKLDIQALGELWEFSSRMFVSGLIDTLFNNADSLVIGKILNISTLGYYYRAKSLENFTMRYTAGSISAVLLPGLSTLQNSPELLKESVKKLFSLISMLSFLVCGLLFVSSKELIVLLFSEKWEPSVVMFQIIIAGAFASQVLNLFYNILLSINKSDVYLKLNIFNKALLTVNFVTLLFGFKTYLFIYVFINFMTFICGLISVSRVLEFGNIFYETTIKYFLIYVLTIILVVALKNYMNIDQLYNLIFGIVFFVSIYSLLQFIFNKHEYEILMAEIKYLRGFDKVSFNE